MFFIMLIFIQGYEQTIPIWAPFGAIIPAILLYLLLFMETHICELIMRDKTNKKGNGVHWDIVLLSLINCLGRLFPYTFETRVVSHFKLLKLNLHLNARF